MTEAEHEMRYRAGSAGLARIGIPDDDPHWYCACGTWRFEAKPGRRGNNRGPAVRAHAAHVQLERHREELAQARELGAAAERARSGRGAEQAELGIRRMQIAAVLDACRVAESREADMNGAAWLVDWVRVILDPDGQTT